MKKLITFILLFCSLIVYSQSLSTVNFVVNTDKFIYNTKYNDFMNVTCPYIKEHNKEIDKILLIGSASPEGNPEWNMRLANLRAAKIRSHLSNFISVDKVLVTNDYELFLQKTGFSEKDYVNLRATCIEILFKEREVQKDTITTKDIVVKQDTIYINSKDTIFIKDTKIDTIYMNKGIIKKLSFSLYNNITTDLIKAPGIGIEFYFHRLSFFIEGNFANTTLIGKTFNYDLWHTGLRKYFNDRYNGIFIELYGRAGYFDIDLFGEDCGKFGIPFGTGFGIGYKFNFCTHVKLYPFIRFGYDYVKYIDYIQNNGDIGVTFNNYTDYKDNSINNSENLIELKQEDKVINKEFFEKSKTAHWFGPTYIGLIFQIDFHRNSNK